VSDGSVRFPEKKVKGKKAENSLNRNLANSRFEELRLTALEQWTRKLANQVSIKTFFKKIPTGDRGFESRQECFRT
jgi:hypothetical protein